MVRRLNQGIEGPRGVEHGAEQGGESSSVEWGRRVSLASATQLLSTQQMLLSPCSLPQPENYQWARYEGLNPDGILISVTTEVSGGQRHVT